MSGSMLQTADAVAENPWKFCLICRQRGNKRLFSSLVEFKSHLRLSHCRKEGGSFVCLYGRNNVCPSLPLEGVHEHDYNDHVEKVHVQLNGRVNDHIVKAHNEVVIPSILQRKSSSSSFSNISYKDDTLIGKDKTVWIQLSSQNLSAVLNDPRKGGRESDFFTRLWGESFVPHDVVPLTLLPNTPRPYFTDFWKKYEIKYMQHERLKRAILAPHTGGKQYESQPKLRDLEAESDVIPEIFLQPGFHLEEPATFNTVLPWSHIHSKSSGQKTSGKLHQEKLTHYLDTIEVKLAHQIATKSDDFFGAMRSQEKFEGEVQQSCQEVKQLRQRLIEMRNRLVKDPLNVMRFVRLRKRYETVEEKLKLMATIHQTQPTIQLLLSNSDFVSALDLIETSLEVLNQELAGIQCFRHLGSQLTEMRRVIERMMTADFIDYALAILNQPHSEDSQIVYEEERLLSVVLGLIHQKKYNFLQLYKTEAYSLIKSTIKQTAHDAVPEELETAEGLEDQIAKFGDYIRSLEHNEWLMVLESVFCVVLQVLKNMKIVHDGLASVFTLAAGIKADNITGTESADYNFVEENAFMEKSECNKLLSENKDILCSACELAQTRCSKVIIMRAKGGLLDRLSSKDFVELARIIEKFASDCEQVSSRQSHNLRGTLLSQAKIFTQRFHEERKHKISNILDIERWKQADVPSEIQNLIDSISDGIEKQVQRKEYEDSNTTTPTLVVQGQHFAVVGTLLILMKMIVEYCQCVDDVPMLASDLLTKLCEILKMFNSRSCQLVLGAGALQTIGLKTITAKHLILVAQCLEVLILHMYIIKNHFEVRLPPKQYVFLSQFDQIVKDYGNHRHEILCKIVNLMEEVFRAHLENYEVRPPMPSKEMRAIVKQIVKLRESLLTVLEGQQLENLFRDIRRCFKSCYADVLAKLKVKNDGGPQHGLVTSDCIFYSSNLKQYSGFTDMDNKFDDLWSCVAEKRKDLEIENNKLKNQSTKNIISRQSKYPQR